MLLLCFAGICLQYSRKCPPLQRVEGKKGGEKAWKIRRRQLSKKRVCAILIMGVYWNAHEPAGIPAMGVNK
ncbi:MAG: hypothetical protein BHW29_13790 [Faecalibacterium sp. CAG:74_58_120]|nr:hypothetical protein [Clostridiales bacterium]OLA21103.1 MAG: hypothetical protein BHW29_13790 [Faecalibacterium sp. CAG:74_58_120]HCI50536.1 hypothetical protein [Clostridiales bacterium]HCJ88579.1 hypothetical protein [Clostridiales bacterium]